MKLTYLKGPDDVVDEEDDINATNELALFFSEKKGELYGSDDPVDVALARRDGISAFEETAGPLAKAVEEMIAKNLAAASDQVGATKASVERRIAKANDNKAACLIAYAYLQKKDIDNELTPNSAAPKIRNILHKNGWKKPPAKSTIRGYLKEKK